VHDNNNDHVTHGKKKWRRREEEEEQEEQQEQQHPCISHSSDRDKANNITNVVPHSFCG
jgi:hypothetical protein